LRKQGGCGAQQAGVICFAKVFYASVHAFFRGLMATASGLGPGLLLPFRPPATGRSSDRWRRSAASLTRFSFAEVPLIASVSSARLRFRAAIRSTTGGGVTTSRGLMGSPFSLAHMLERGMTIHVAVVDFAMPGMNGAALVQAARHLQPGCRSCSPAAMPTRPRSRLSPARRSCASPFISQNLPTRSGARFA
jgi:hypothetical protein